nr:MAG TPA: hypothetical protein [Caudoviricetes sp.]
MWYALIFPRTSGITCETVTMRNAPTTSMAAISTTRIISARSSPPIMLDRQQTWTARPVGNAPNLYGKPS